MKPDQEAAARIEARLERSLRHQVKAPRLDGRFDAAVWSRIAAQAAAVPSPTREIPRMPRWLVASNALGGVVTVVVLVWCVMRAMAGVQLPSMGVEWPAFTSDQVSSLLRISGTVIAALAMAFGLGFTRIGRRVLAEFR